MMNMMMETQANERKTVRSKLDEVTVFFHGAELKHSAEIALTQGENEVWIEGLSTQIDAGSLNIRAGAGIVSRHTSSCQHMYRSIFLIRCSGSCATHW